MERPSLPPTTADRPHVTDEIVPQTDPLSSPVKLSTPPKACDFDTPPAQAPRSAGGSQAGARQRLPYRHGGEVRPSSVDGPRLHQRQPTRRPTARGRRPELPSEAQLRAVELDASISSGRVCLLYAGGEGRAQVWFQDASCSWSFIASSFVDYFRLMVLHRGLPRWQYQYTDAGLDSVAKAWWRAFAADRCGSDTENRAQQVEYDVSRPAPFSWWHTFRLFAPLTHCARLSLGASPLTQRGFPALGRTDSAGLSGGSPERRRFQGRISRV